MLHASRKVVTTIVIVFDMTWLKEIQPLSGIEPRTFFDLQLNALKSEPQLTSEQNETEGKEVSCVLESDYYVIIN